MEKLIITAAICGAEVTKEQNINVPYTIEEIATEAEKAYKARASIIHLHVRNDDGSPTQNINRFKACYDVILKRCPDVIIQPSTGGAIGMSNTERLQPIQLNPEMATLDCGTCNFGGDDIFVNTENTIIEFANQMNFRGIKPELECFDKGMVDMALLLNNRGYIKSPMHFNFVLGVPGAISATAQNLLFLVQSIPKSSTFTVTGIGKNQFNMAAISIVIGGHVRVGFEDNLYLSKSILANTNGELVDKIVRISNELGREIASADEARKILKLK